MIGLCPLASDYEKALLLYLALVLLCCSPVRCLRFYQDALCLSKEQLIAFFAIRGEICLSEMESIVWLTDFLHLTFCLVRYFYCFACVCSLSEDCCYANQRVSYSTDCSLLFSYSQDCSMTISQNSHRHLKDHLFHSRFPPRDDNCLQLIVIVRNRLELKKFGFQLLQLDYPKR